MKFRANWIGLTLASIFAIGLLGCGDSEPDLSGTYVRKREYVDGKLQRATKTSTLTLTKDGKFVRGTGDGGTYSFSDGAVTMSGSILGTSQTAIGNVEGPDLVFPDVHTNNWFGSDLEGLWTRQR